MSAGRPVPRIAGATDGDPWAQSTWSGSSARLWAALDRAGALAGVVSAKPRWLDLAEKAASVSRDRAVWRQRYRGAASPVSPLVRAAMTAIGSRRATRAAPQADAVLQISGWYDARRGRPPGTLLCSYQDANVALWRRRPDLLLDPADRALARTFEHERRAYRSMDLVMTMSDWARRSFVEDFGVPPERVVTVGAGANLELLPGPVVREPSPPRVLFVGLKFVRKGGPELLAAFERLRTEHPGAELWIVGPPPGPSAPGVRWFGPVYRRTPEGARELDRLFREATMFAMPSVYEGFGMPFLEAMAYGLPCVGTDVSAIPEIVRDGQPGCSSRRETPAPCTRRWQASPPTRAGRPRSARAAAPMCSRAGPGTPSPGGSHARSPSGCPSARLKQDAVAGRDPERAARTTRAPAAGAIVRIVTLPRGMLPRRTRTSPTDAIALRAEAAAHRSRHGAAGVAGRVRRLLGVGETAPTATDLNIANVLAAAERLGVEAETLPGGFVELTRDGTTFYSHSSDFAFEPLVPYFMCGDKGLTSRRLAEHGLPVPRFGVFDVGRFAEALRLFDRLPKPVVTKPARGTAGGVGITLGITTRVGLRSGFARARAHSRDVLVEEQVGGDNLRVTVLAGHVIGAVRRIPAHVVGDGVRTVADLVEAKNALWRSGARENRLLRPITLDVGARRVLRRHGVNARSVPAAADVVSLREVSNADQGGEIADVTDELHDDVRDLAVAAARVLGPVLCGVDLIVADVRAPALPGGVYINEVNTTPSLYVANAVVDGAPSTHAAECALRHLFGLG